MADENNEAPAPQTSAGPEGESVNEQPNESPKPEPAKHAGPEYKDTVEVSEDDFPSLADDGVNVKRGDDPDPNEGWTVQAVVGDEDREGRPYVVPDVEPGYVVKRSELPTKEGLEAHGIDPVSYVAAVPVRD